MHKIAPYVLAAFSAVLIAGCGGPAQVVSPVKGRVMYQGKPVPYGQVMFQPETGDPARGEIQPDGSYVLTTYAPGDGATIGKNYVRITSIPAQRPEAASQAVKGELSSVGSTIPPKYSHFRTSGIEVVVQAGTNADANFELTD